MSQPRDVSPQTLSALPIYAVVAFAARCARRAESRLVATDGYPVDPAYRVTLDAAIRTAEAFARGEAIDSASAYEAAKRADEIASTIDQVKASRRWHAMRAASMAAQTAQDAVRGQVPDTADEFGHQLAVEHAREVAAKAYVADMIASGIGGIRGESMYDLQALVDLQLGQSPDYGRPIEDLSETGPLGSLWPRGEPNRPSGLNAPVQSWGYVMTRRRFWLGLALVFVVAIVVLAVSGTLGEIIKTIRWVPGS